MKRIDKNYVINNYDTTTKELKRSYSEIIITNKGKDDFVMLSYDDYRLLVDELELYRDLAEAEDNFINNRTVTRKQLHDSIYKMFH